MADLAQAVPPGDEEDLPAHAERLFDCHRAHPEALRLLMWEALELGDRPVPGEEARTQHYEHKIRATQTASDGEARDRLFFTLGLVGWSLAMP